MKLSEAERGMLMSKMSDATVASIFGRRESWVRKARAWLAGNPADAVICAKPEKAPRSVRKAVSPKPAPQVKQAPDPEPKPAPGRMLTIQETIAACPQNFLVPLSTPIGRAKPDGYTGLANATIRIPLKLPAGVAEGEPPPSPAVVLATWRAGAAAKPATRPPVAPPAPDPGITPAVLRYAKWFHDAKWTWREISELFEVEAIALRYALTGELPQA